MMEKSNRLAATNPSSASNATTSAAASDASGLVFPTTENSNSNSGRYSNHITKALRTLNKSSYKISKSPPRPTSLNSCTAGPSAGGGQQPQQQPQPPVYNIDKNDFRDVVQKLTGSPAHFSVRPTPAPPPAVAPSPPQPPPLPSSSTQPLSRLHRIRPPPLAQLSPRPPLPIAAAGEGWVRPPLSPLPPFPVVSAAAESPISAYMRRFHGGQTLLSPPSLPPFLFGCAPSPRSAAPYQMSPTSMLPTSPGPPMPSPRCGDH